MLADPSWKEDIIPEIWEGKNIADFIDLDIAEKLEALEREEEKLQAEGFYDDEEEMIDSDEELYAAEAEDALKHKLLSERKKMFKNRPVMPRTAGMRTLSEMSKKLTAAGIDPSRIEARAEILSKAAHQKRKRDEQMEVDNDDDDGFEDESGDEMDVDGADTSMTKRAKGNAGGVVARGKQPHSNRQMAGFKNVEVRSLSCLFIRTRSIANYPTSPRLSYLASKQGNQATESRPTRAEHAGQGRRRRQADQDQDGTSVSLSFLARLSPIPSSYLTSFVSSL